MSLPLVLASSVLCLFFSNGKAQSIPPIAQCHVYGGESPTEWTWMNNTRGQGACEVASYLQISCAGKDSAVLQGLVNSGAYYEGPIAQSPCLCNTVMYSLTEACQLCQYNVPGNVLQWSVYATNCTDRTNGSYPFAVPPGTAIPAWAYQDVLTTDKFDLFKAKEVAVQGLPDVTGSPTSSSASSTATATTSSSLSTGASSNVGAIVGGVVGGVLGVLLIGTIAICVFLRKRKIRRQAQVEPSISEASERPISTATAIDSHQPSLKPMSMISTPSMIYDPNDPRTFPSFQTSPSPSEMRAASPALSGPPGSIGGYMPHSFGAMQDYSGSSFYGGDYGHGNAASTYTGAPEV